MSTDVEEKKSREQRMTTFTGAGMQLTPVHKHLLREHLMQLVKACRAGDVNGAADVVNSGRRQVGEAPRQVRHDHLGTAQAETQAVGEMSFLARTQSEATSSGGPCASEQPTPHRRADQQSG